MAHGVGNIELSVVLQKVVINVHRIHQVAPHCLVSFSYTMAANCAPESDRLHFNCAKMENKLDELSHISGSRLRHRSSVACGDAESQVG